jgi:DNA-binding Lrp family transcriptional regulator
MDARAYLLIEADAGEIGAVIRALSEISGIRAVDAVTGPYDIIATIETPDQRMIGRLVIDEIHRITGIKRTITCLAIPNEHQNTSRGATIARSTV